jgi:hypothetical protein
VKFRRKKSDQADQADPVETTEATDPGETVPASAPAERSQGPWDSSEVNLEEEDPTRVDLGGLVVKGGPGLERGSRSTRPARRWPRCCSWAPVPRAPIRRPQR